METEPKACFLRRRGFLLITILFMVLLALLIGSSFLENRKIEYGLTELKKLSFCQNGNLKFIKKTGSGKTEQYEYQDTDSGMLYDFNPSGGLAGVYAADSDMPDSAFNITDDDAIRKAAEYVGTYFPDVNLSEMQLAENELKNDGFGEKRTVRYIKYSDTGLAESTINVVLDDQGELQGVFCYNDKLLDENHSE